MQLTEDQARIARQWLEDGMELSEFQKRLKTEFELNLTYMEVRFLLDDLKVVPKDPEVPEPDKLPPDAADGSNGVPGEPSALTDPDVLPPEGQIALSVDVVTQPGMIISGKVTFSDGQKASWHLDNFGRPGLVPEQKGYRPSREDIERFQIALEKEISRHGF